MSKVAKIERRLWVGKRRLSKSRPSGSKLSGPAAGYAFVSRPESESCHWHRNVFATTATVSFPPVCCHSGFRAVRQQGAQNGRSCFPIAAGQPNPGSANLNAPKLPVATSPSRPQAVLQIFPLNRSFSMPKELLARLIGCTIRELKTFPTASLALRLCQTRFCSYNLPYVFSGIFCHLSRKPTPLQHLNQ